MTRGDAKHAEKARRGALRELRVEKGRVLRRLAELERLGLWRCDEWEDGRLVVDAINAECARLGGVA